MMVVSSPELMIDRRISTRAQCNPITFAHCGVRSPHHLKEIITRLRKACPRSAYRYTMLERAKR